MKNLDKPLASEIVIFGALGDLSRRKLLPSLYQLELAGLLSVDTRIIAVARNDLALEDFTKQINDSLNEFIPEALDEDIVSKFLSRLVYQQLDFKDINAYKNLAETLATFEEIADDVPGMLDFSHGPNLDFEQKSAGFSGGFIITFTDRAAHLEYETHPLHISQGAKLVSMCEGGADGT